MGNIDLLIKIPEEIACEGFERPFTEEEKNILIKAIGNGTPLPKGHGRLIDADALMYRQTHHGNYYTPFELIDSNGLDNALTIIEADTESKEVLWQ